MGIFDGVLIASDWDGTLCMGKSIPDKNIEAIRYFQENGGAFTVCSGRYYPYIESFSDKVKPNTYIISLNGAYVIHTETRHVLHEGTVSDAVFKFIDDLSEIDNLFYGMTIYLSGCESGLSLTREEYLATRSNLLGKGVYKVIFVTATPEKAIYIRDAVNESGSDELVAVRSWHTGVEILGKNNTKGSAVRKVADAIGARLVVAVGDYENDISMIESADIGYAVENATDSLKGVADRSTVNVAEGAIAAVIYELEAELRAQRM
jgi:Cof subfamily protein (haloacid dehalogenase superfamily)